MCFTITLPWKIISTVETISEFWEIHVLVMPRKTYSLTCFLRANAGWEAVHHPTNEESGLKASWAAGFHFPHSKAGQTEWVKITILIRKSEANCQSVSSLLLKEFHYSLLCPETVSLSSPLVVHIPHWTVLSSLKGILRDSYFFKAN